MSCTYVIERRERIFCHGCGSDVAEVDRTGLGHVIMGSVPDQCGPIEVGEAVARCGHPESAHRHSRVVGVWCISCYGAFRTEDAGRSAHAYTEEP